jgi:hypothetical protein
MTMAPVMEAILRPQIGDGSLVRRSCLVFFLIDRGLAQTREKNITENITQVDARVSVTY